MDALLIMFKNVLIFVALALPGFILVKTKILKTAESGVLSKLLTFVGMPFLIISSTLGIDFSGDFAITAVIAALSCFVLTVAAFFLSAPLTLYEKESKKRGMMRFSMVFSNNGFLGIPLAMAVFGSTHVIVQIVIVLNIINNILIYTLGVYLISGDKKQISLKKAFLNPVLIAFVIALIINLSGVLNAVGINKEITDFATHLKNLVTPISMIILGIKLADIPFRYLFNSASNYYVSAIKLILLPVLVVAVGFALQHAFNLTTDIVMAFFIGFSMPTAGLSTTFADQFNGDTKNSVIYTLGSTMFSIITIPLLYFALNAII